MHRCWNELHYYCKTRKDRLLQLAKELGDTCIPIAGDVTEPGFNAHLIDQSNNIYAVFANAGHGLDQRLIEFDAEQFKQLFDLNVFAAVELASLAAIQMVNKKRRAYFVMYKLSF